MVERKARRVTAGSGADPASGDVRATRGSTVVVKLGGRSLDAPGALDELATELASFPDRVLLVHGGGHEVTDWSRRLGLEPRFVDGLRITDDATLEVAVAVLAGLANKRLVARLRHAGVDAIGLSAADGVAATAPHPDAMALGRVGSVETVDVSLLAALIEAGRTPVLASIGACAGALLNLNADDLAAAVAAALGADALVLLSDAPGVVIDGAVVPSIAADALDQRLAHPEVQGGMIAKLVAARATLAAGVATVRIGAWTGPGTLSALLAGQGGTLLHAAPTPSDRTRAAAGAATAR